MAWPVELLEGSAAEIHGRELPDPATRAVWRCQVTEPALVLGSAQPPDDVDVGATARAGIDVVRRRSGGGAVLLVPGEHLWVDVVVPRADALWDDDVGRAAHWVGEAWAAAVAGPGVRVHRGGLARTRWSSKVCFAGVGPGEVSVAGRKLVGISQRRTRGTARFQCVVHARWDAAELLELLALGTGERTEAAAAIRVATVADLDALFTAFHAALPA